MRREPDNFCPGTINLTCDEYRMKAAVKRVERNIGPEKREFLKEIMTSRYFYVSTDWSIGTAKFKGNGSGTEISLVLGNDRGDRGFCQRPLSPRPAGPTQQIADSTLPVICHSRRGPPRSIERYKYLRGSARSGPAPKRGRRDDLERGGDGVTRESRFSLQPRMKEKREEGRKN